MQSTMGDVAGNLARIESLVREAARRGARVCVLPECAIPGYCDMTQDIYWGTHAEAGFLDVHTVAESIPGPSTDRLAKLADELDVYLTVPLLERAEEEGADGPKERFYNSVALVGPDGELCASYRKRVLWTIADTYCMTEGPERVCTIDTPYGRLGLMICRDVHKLVRELGEAGTDIILDCVAWYGPNSEGWFEGKLAWMVQDANAYLVLANWTFANDPGWSGYGLSRVIAPDGKAIAKCKSDLGYDIVMAEIPVRQDREQSPGK
jgi:predicted amidohydrolase